ncbi:VOC family protein [Sporosarcina sp. FSL W7-1349]|uniref:VOC family protein n=1 Tax=Sporosarcina sp. FSL W7-1349 TaxID=2921561 RepID=UPI0030F6AA90
MNPEIAKLGHVSLVTPNLEKSLWFFHEVLGLEITERSSDTVYLRAYGEFEHHSLVLKAGDRAYMDHIGWRVKRPEDVEQFEHLLKQSGTEVQKILKGHEAGQGDAIRFQMPTGHNFELYYDVQKPLAPEGERSVLKNQTHKAWNRGISPRRIDHVNVWTTHDPSVSHNWLSEQLGFKMREYIRVNNEQVLAGWMSVTPLVHDIAVMGMPNAATPARLHHVAYWLDNAQDVLRACDILRENGIVPDSGPGKHGISQALFTYVRDPGSGHRVELFSNSYLIFDPDWEPLEWTEKDMDLGLTYWGPTEYVPNQNNHAMDQTTEALSQLSSLAAVAKD